MAFSENASPARMGDAAGLRDRSQLDGWNAPKIDDELALEQAKLVHENTLKIEQGWLGKVLLEPDVFDSAERAGLTAEAFLAPDHGRIFAAMERRRGEGKSLDIGLLASELLELGGGQAQPYLSHLATWCAMPRETVAEYAGDIVEAFRKRQLVAFGQEIEALGLQPGIRSEDIGQHLVEEGDRLVSGRLRPGQKPRSIGESARAHLAEFAVAPPREPAKFLLPDLDRLIRPWKAPSYGVLAGRPSMGKSGVAIQIALNVATQGFGVLYFSLEMDASEITARMLASIIFDSPDLASIIRRDGGQVNYSEMLRQPLSAAYLAAGEKASLTTDKLPITLIPKSGLTVSQIAARTRQHVAAANAGHLALIMVDHLGLMMPSTRYSGNRVQEISEISAGLFALSQDFGVRVLALSQLNRSTENRPADQRRPMLADLRDSGSIEQDADFVIGIYRAAYYLEREGEREDAEKEEQRQIELLGTKNILEFNVLKNRAGATGGGKLWADMGANYFGGYRE